MMKGSIACQLTQTKIRNDEFHAFFPTLNIFSFIFALLEHYLSEVFEAYLEYFWSKYRLNHYLGS